MLRRLHPDQPESFAFTPDNLAWAEAQITKYPEGRQASAVIPLLWRAQEQEGWLTRAAMETVAEMLGMAYIRVLEVATFYFMFQLQPVGSVSHFQICGTTSCMICGAEDLISVCREKIAPAPHMLSEDGRFSWEEVECLGACANAPVAQIGKDYFEDLSAESFGEIIDALARGEVPRPGSQTGRFASEPINALTSLDEGGGVAHQANASVSLAEDLGDTIKRIDGGEVPLSTPWQRRPQEPAAAAEDPGWHEPEPRPGEDRAADETGVTEQEATADSAARPDADVDPGEGGTKPQMRDGPREGRADDLKLIKGIGPKLEALCHQLGVYHFDQIASWGAAEVAWMDANLTGFRSRVSRDDWVGQARVLVAGGETDFSVRAKRGDVD